MKPSERQQILITQREAEKKVRLETQRGAVRDLAQRLGGVPIQDITLSSWSERMWMFNDVGCVQPGEIAVPTETPGWMFIFRYAGTPELLYIYNATRDGKKFKFCRTQSLTTE